MDDNNNAQVNNNEQQSQQGGGKKKGTTYIDYTLMPLVDNAVFVIHKQHPDVARFLNSVGSFRAANGVTISLGLLFPEWKESMDTIYLDGTNGRAYNRPDVTRLAPVLHYRKNGSDKAVVLGRQARNNKIRRFHDAIAELCDVVSMTYGTVAPESVRPDLGRTRVIA